MNIPILIATPALQEATREYLGFSPWEVQGLYSDPWWERKGLGDYTPILPLSLPVGRDIAARWIGQRIGLGDSVLTPNLKVRYKNGTFEWCFIDEMNHYFWLPGTEKALHPIIALHMACSVLQEAK